MYEATDWMTTTPGPSTTASIIPMVDYELLYTYCRGSDFPSHCLKRKGVSNEAIDFVKSLMVADPNKRVSAKDALESRWLMPGLLALLRREFEQLSVDLTGHSASQLLYEEDKATII